MPKYRITGTSLRNGPHKEVVDAESPKFALSIAYTRGMSPRHPLRLAEIDPDGDEISVQEIPADLSQGITFEAFNNPMNSRLLRDPITTIALGVFGGLILFMLFTFVLSRFLGEGLYLDF